MTRGVSPAKPQIKIVSEARVMANGLLLCEAALRQPTDEY